jgi:acetyl-CoA carboxylase biotin carboxyl carrier protein
VSDRPEIDDMCQSLTRLLATSARPVRRVRLQRGDLIVEMEWPDEVAVAPAGSVAATPAPAPDQDADAGLTYVCAAMVGTFYRAPQPDAEPFVQEGDTVRAGQQVAALEAMKMIMPVHATDEGEVVKILVPNGTPVEYGERLIAIAPTSD